MSLALHAVRGAVWTIGVGAVARGLGLLGILLLTHRLSPTVYGEVSSAAIVVLTANHFSRLGLGQYLVAHPRSGPAVAFHATFYHLAFGAVALGATVLLRQRIGIWFHTPGLGRYVPGLAVALWMERVAMAPERLALAALRFRWVALARALSELVYVGVSVTLAFRGWGGTSMVAGNLVRYFLLMVLLCSAVHPREWLRPRRLDRKMSRRMFAFGLPVSIAAFIAFASRRWDNMLVTYFFGPAVMGAYNLAYNVADLPASYVGEQIGDVLLPSLVRLSPEQRRFAFLRAARLMALVVFPLGAGLAVIAPTLAAFLGAAWTGVAGMLSVLCALSIGRPLGWLVSSHLQAVGRPRLILILEASKLLVLVIAIVTLGRLGPLFTCTAVGLAFVLHTLASLWALRTADQVPLYPLIGGLVPTLLACVPMVGAVLCAQHVGLARHAGFGFSLVGEILAGVVSYVLSALVLARPVSREFLGLVRNALRPLAVPISESDAIHGPNDDQGSPESRRASDG